MSEDRRSREDPIGPSQQPTLAIKSFRSQNAQDYVAAAHDDRLGKLRDPPLTYIRWLPAVARPSFIARFDGNPQFLVVWRVRQFGNRDHLL